MVALTKYRDTRRMGDGVIPDLLDFAVADNVRIFKGAIVGLVGGFASPAGPTCTRVAGVAESEADNTQQGHAAGAMRIRVRQGVFKVANSAAAEALASADVGGLCYAADDQTVAKTNGATHNLPVAGTVIRVDADGVWVQMNLDGAR
jgi:hypothetical protein